MLLCCVYEMIAFPFVNLLARELRVNKDDAEWQDNYLALLGGVGGFFREVDRHKYPVHPCLFFPSQARHQNFSIEARDSQKRGFWVLPVVWGQREMPM